MLVRATLASNEAQVGVTGGKINDIFLGNLRKSPLDPQSLGLVGILM